MEQLPKWALPVGAAIVLLLILRARGSSTAGGARTLSTDVTERQSVAEALQLDQAKKQAAYNDQLRALDLRARQDYANLTHALYTGGPYADGIKCAKGKPRIDPATGRIYCRAQQGGGLTLGSLLGAGLSAYNSANGKVLS